MTGLPIAKLIELLGWHWRPASKDTPLLEPSLPHPEDQNVGEKEASGLRGGEHRNLSPFSGYVETDYGNDSL